MNKKSIMSEKQEYKGTWFLPENPEQEIAGILYFIPNETIRLELIGSLSETNCNYIGRFNKYPIIHGVVKTKDIISKVTLFDCYAYPAGGGHNLIQDCKLRLMNYNCSYILLGKHLTSKADSVFNKIRVSFPYFNDWYKDNNIRFDAINDYTATFTTCNSNKYAKTYKLNNNVDLNINGYSDFYNTKPNEYYLFEDSYVELVNTEKSNFYDLLVNIGWFKDFYSFAALTSMPFTEIFLYDYDDFEIEKGVSLFYIVEERFDKKDNILPFHHFLFSFGDIENDFETIIKTWYDKKETSEPIIQQLIASVTFKKFFKKSDFLTVIQAIEGYFCRFIGNDKKSLKDKLDAIYNIYCIDVKIIKDNKLDTNKIRETRNYFSHLYKDDNENVCKEWKELSEMTEKLKPLLVCCILSLVGFDNDKINYLLSNCYQFGCNFK